MNCGLGILILGQIVAQVFQGASYVPGPQKVGPRSFQDHSDFIGKGRMLEQVRSFRARANLDPLVFTQAGQSLQGLAHHDDSSLHFLLTGKEIGQLLLGGFVRLLIIGG